MCDVRSESIGTRTPVFSTDALASFTMSSSAEMEYTLAGCAADVREDGRSCLDVRHMCLELDVLPQASGSSRLVVGGGSFSTELLVGVVAVLAEPDPATGPPNAGRIAVSVGINGPGDAIAAGLPEYDGAAIAADDKRLWLEAALSRLYTYASIPVALRTLCISPGRQCWELRVHVQILRTDGCPLDAASLAVRAALHATRVPRVMEIDAAAAAAGEATGGKRSKHESAGAGTQLDLDLDETLDDSTPFDASSASLYVTLCDMGGRFVADCTGKERRACGSAFSLALDADGSVTALVGGGGYGLHLEAMGHAIAAARSLGSELHIAAAGAVSAAAADAERREAGTAGATANAGYSGLLT